MSKTHELINSETQTDLLEIKPNRLKEYNKKYYQEHKDKHKKYYEEHKTEILERAKTNYKPKYEPEYFKQYRQKNKEKLNEYLKNYRKLKKSIE
jgi:hypothetical protein